jgi:hypothetical protein
LFAYSNDAELAFDAAAEAFAQALGRGMAIRDVRSWVWRTAFRVAAGDLKSRSRYALGPIPEGATHDFHLDDELVAALQGLTPQQRLVIVLHYYVDCPVGEISRACLGRDVADAVVAAAELGHRGGAVAVGHRRRPRGGVVVRGGDDRAGIGARRQQPVGSPGVGHRAGEGRAGGAGQAVAAVVAEATPLGTDETTQGTTIGATVEAGEPLGSSCAIREGRTVWYRVVTGATGRLTVATAPTGPSWSLETHLFVGNSLPELTHVACGGRSGLGADVVKGQTYYLRIGGSGLTAGSFTLTTSFELPPDNDAIMGSQTITPPGSVSGSTTSATTAADEPVPSCRRFDDVYAPVTKTVWYRVMPQVSGTLLASTSANSFDTVLALYEPSAGGGLPLVELQCNDRYGSTPGLSIAARISHPVVSGRSYYLQLGGYNQSHGSFTLDMVVVDPPGNDDWADATSLLTDASATGDTTGATPEQDIDLSCAADKSVWFRLVPDDSGRLSVRATSVNGGEYVPVIAVHPADADGVPSRGYLDCMVARGVPASVAITVEVDAGLIYYIRLGGHYETAGQYRLELTFDPTPPPTPGPSVTPAPSATPSATPPPQPTATPTPSAAPTLGGTPAPSATPTPSPTPMPPASPATGQPPVLFTDTADSAFSGDTAGYGTRASRPAAARRSSARTTPSPVVRWRRSSCVH